MLYDTGKTIQENIEQALVNSLNVGNRVSREESNRHFSDAENREAVEQALTDQYLDMIEAQQEITEMQLKMIGG